MASSKRYKATRRSSSGWRKWLLPLGILLLLFLSLPGLMSGKIIGPATGSNARARVFQTALSTPEVNPILANAIVAVAMHESNDFSSDLYLTTNNAFGMKVASQREQNRTGEYSGYAMYKNVEDSTKDFIAWLKFNNYVFPSLLQSKDEITQAKELVAFMKSKNYFQDTLANYADGVVNRIKFLMSNHPSVNVPSQSGVSLFTSAGRPDLSQPQTPTALVGNTQTVYTAPKPVTLVTDNKGNVSVYGPIKR